MANDGKNISPAIAAGIICFALGVGAGSIGTVFFGKSLIKDSNEVAGAPARQGGGQGPGANNAGMRMQGGMGMGGARAGGGGRGPSSKTQLTTLVNKLDQLTGKPLAVSLTEEQSRKVREQLAGLSDKDELSDEDAKKKLDTILEVIANQKEVLESAGYRWPGQPPAIGGGNRPPGGEVPANPFKDEQNGGRLKSLQERLAKGNNLG